MASSPVDQFRNQMHHDIGMEQSCLACGLFLRICSMALSLWIDLCPEIDTFEHNLCCVCVTNSMSVYRYQAFTASAADVRTYVIDRFDGYMNRVWLS